MIAAPPPKVMHANVSVLADFLGVFGLCTTQERGGRGALSNAITKRDAPNAAYGEGIVCGVRRKPRCTLRSPAGIAPVGCLH